MLLEGKKAIITGGTRGIGYAIAARFIEEGAVVTVFGSRQETADKAVEQLLATYPRQQRRHLSVHSAARLHGR